MTSRMGRRTTRVLRAARKPFALAWWQLRYGNANRMPIFVTLAAIAAVCLWFFNSAEMPYKDPRWAHPHHALGPFVVMPGTGDTEAARKALASARADKPGLPPNHTVADVRAWLDDSANGVLLRPRVKRERQPASVDGLLLPDASRRSMIPRRLTPVCYRGENCAPDYPVGSTPKEVQVVAGPDTVGSVVAMRFGMPWRSIGFLDGAGRMRTMAPWSMSVDAGGKVVTAMPSADRLLDLCRIALVAWLCGALADRVYKAFRNDYGHHPYEGVARFLAGVATFGMFCWMADAALWNSLYPTAAVGLLWPLSTRRRALLILGGLAFMAVAELIDIPLTSPAPSIAVLYGPLGVRAWDIMTVGSFALLASVISLFGLVRRSGEVNVHVSTGRAPLIQDVRIVGMG